jgi:competence protein ComEC
MAALVLVAGLLGRRSDARHALAMAVVVLLLVDPLLAGHLGFALSVGATAGVLVLAPWLADRLPGPRPVRLLLAASLGAQVGAAPVLLTLEQGIGLATVPANLVAVPLAAAGQALGLAAVLVGVASAPAGGVVALLAGPFAGGILRVAELASGGPRVHASDVAAAAVSPLVVLLVVAVLARGRLATAALVGVVAIAGVGMLRPPPAVAHLTVTALDVGQGDAILVEVPGPVRLLVDGGPEPGLALRRLRERGVRALDAVVVSHPHHDHTGGLPAVLAALPVGALLVGPTPLDPATATLSAAETERIATARGVPIVRVAAGDRFGLGPAVVRVLSPPADDRFPDDLNERSVVLSIADAAGSVLLTGDAEAGAQARLLDDPEALRATILKVPHHGAATNHEGFLAAVGARHALIGVGAGNTYGHPAPSTMAALAGVAVHRTDTDGTVSLAVTPEGVVRRRRGLPRRGRRGCVHSAPCHGPPCTSSPVRRSSSCDAPRSSCSTSSPPRARSSPSTSAPPSSARAGSRTSAPARCSAPAAS